MYRIVVLALLMFSFAGCGSEEKVTVDINADGPLTVEEWQELDVLVKYELETFERLKEGDPKLQDERNWKKFMRDVVVPARQKDIPTDY